MHGTVRDRLVQFVQMRNLLIIIMRRESSVEIEIQENTLLFEPRRLGLVLIKQNRFPVGRVQIRC